MTSGLSLVSTLTSRSKRGAPPHQQDQTVSKNLDTNYFANSPNVHLKEIISFLSVIDLTLIREVDKQFLQFADKQVEDLGFTESHKQLYPLISKFLGNRLVFTDEQKNSIRSLILNPNELMSFLTAAKSEDGYGLSLNSRSSAMIDRVITDLTLNRGIVNYLTGPLRTRKGVIGAIFIYLIVMFLFIWLFDSKADHQDEFLKTAKHFVSNITNNSVFHFLKFLSPFIALLLGYRLSIMERREQASEQNLTPEERPLIQNQPSEIREIKLAHLSLCKSIINYKERQKNEKMLGIMIKA